MNENGPWLHVNNQLYQLTESHQQLRQYIEQEIATAAAFREWAYIAWTRYFDDSGFDDNPTMPPPTKVVPPPPADIPVVAEAFQQSNRALVGKKICIYLSKHIGLVV
ncbi:hypothetical protein QQ045_007247 [Rhodiola kirilowii]